MVTLPLYKDLKAKQIELSKSSLAELFKQERHFLSLELEDCLFDFSKNLLDLEILRLLLEWAKTEQLQEKVANLYDSKASHVALRETYKSDSVQTELNKIEAFSTRIRNQKIIKTIVNLGVGGSDLGIALCLEALEPEIPTFCISSVDGMYLHGLLEKLNPETTLFVVSSKSFTTQDTLLNANLVKKRFKNAHFVGVSANKKAMDDYGILPEHQFYLWDWVGGRYSVSSAIGLPIAIAIGMDNFNEFLSGMRLVDEHFLRTPLEQNIPVIMGLLAVWYINFWGAEAHAILPYDERLQKLPAYLGQLEMESLGKQVRNDGKIVNYQTCPIVFGEVGTKAQHSFFQLLHQGTRFVSADFIGLATSNRFTLANCLAQTRTLAMENRPSTTILLNELSPKTLGMLIALYEHKVFVESVLWNINPFDQPGVELGKQIAKTVLPYIGQKTDQFDWSTNRLLDYIATVKTPSPVVHT